jgi:fatty-acyl-CoA synthase
MTGQPAPAPVVVPPLDSPSLTLGGFLREITGRYGERIALVSRERQVTYAELGQQAYLLARALVAAGVSRGTPVAVLAPNSVEWVATYFAVGLIGAVLVPVNTFATAEERDYILRHSDAAVLLLMPEFLRHRYLEDLLERHPAIAQSVPGSLQIPELPFLRRIVSYQLLAPVPPGVQSFGEFVAAAAGVPEALVEAMAASIHPADDAMIIYTSGTTARPKGVIHVQRPPVLQSWRFAEQLRLSPDDRIWSAYPYFWSAGMAMVIGGTLASGATLIIEDHFDPAMALDTIERERATILFAWPHQSAELAEEQRRRPRDLSSIRRTANPSPLDAFLPNAAVEDQLIAAFGLSETFTIATSLPVDAPVELRRSTHGLPLPGMEVRIVDPDTGEPLPQGQPGEIAVRGVTLMRGYAKTLPEHVFDRDGFFRTKDGGWIDEAGYLHWTGRISAMIKTGGANVSPLEIETALAQWGRLKTALAVGVPHPTLGEMVVLCAVRNEGDPVSEEEVQQYLRQRLAAYKVPRRVLFVAPEDLSFTGNAKIQLQQLRELAVRLIRAEATAPSASV